MTEPSASLPSVSWPWGRHEGLESGLGEDHVVRDENVVRVQLARLQDVDLGQVAGGQPRGLVGALDDQEHVLALADLAEELFAAFVEGVSPSITPVMTWMRALRARSVRAWRRAAAFIFFGVRCE